MVGDLIGESSGRRIVRRVLSSEPLTMEVTFESSGIGEGDGGMVSEDGELITWKGSGLGKIGEGASASYRGIIYFRTDSEKLASLNSAPGVFEFEVDADGNTASKVWQWK